MMIHAVHNDYHSKFKILETCTLFTEKHPYLFQLTQTIDAAFWSRDQQLCWEKGVTPWQNFPTVSSVIFNVLCNYICRLANRRKIAKHEVLLNQSCI